jgi:hypothetical protein
VSRGQHGADINYDYGNHFLFQGHEGGTKNPSTGSRQGYITRINLDADGEHRVTLLAMTDKSSNSLPVFDGSTWYPFSSHLLFISETSTAGGVWQATPDFPSTVEDISGIVGRGGYEGIQADSLGNLIIVEDVGGVSGTNNPHARQPNSFIYRFVPKNPKDLTQGGRLRVLQAMSKSHQGPIVFHAGQADPDILSQDVKDLHTYGNIFLTNWITIHDTSVNGFTPFDANALAKATGGTPFKRPENGQFQPSTNFTMFFFDETGDTNALTEAGAQYGGFGAIMKLTQSPSNDTGTLPYFIYVTKPFLASTTLRFGQGI